MNPKLKVSLCPDCCCCPEVAIYDNEVLIGEKENLVKLKKDEWNQLVDQIQKSNLKKID